MKVGDMICVSDFHDLCPRLRRKVGIMEFGLKTEERQLAAAEKLCV